VTGELPGAAAGAVLATGVATYAGVRLRRQMPIVTWRAWVAGFPLKAVAWALAVAVTLAVAATAFAALVTTVLQQNDPAAVAHGDHSSPAAVPAATSDRLQHHFRAAAGPATRRSRRTPSAARAILAASHPRSRSPGRSRATSPGCTPSPRSASPTPVPTRSPTPTPTPTPTPSPTVTPSPTATPSPTGTPWP
jgi:cell division protein FtsN